MILTTQDYVRHYANDRLAGDPIKENRVLTFLDYLFANKTVLFIGYGLEELEILEYIILKARRTLGSPSLEAKHYILQGFFSHEQALIRQLTRRGRGSEPAACQNSDQAELQLRLRQKHLTETGGNVG